MPLRVLAALMVLIPGFAVAAEPQRIYTSELAPVVMEGANPAGYAREIVGAMLAEAGVTASIIVLPWARALELTRQEPEALIFPLSLNQSRRTSFAWGPALFTSTTRFVSRGDAPLTLEAARPLRIGVHNGSGADDFLKENGFAQVTRLPSEGEMIARLLLSGRIDAWLTDISIARHVLGRIAGPDIVYSAPVQTVRLHLASNPDLPSRHLDALSAAHRRLVERGEVKSILSRYGFGVGDLVH